MSLRSLLTATVTIGVPGSIVRDSAGGYSDTLTKTGYAASVQVDSSSAGQQYMRETKRRLFSIYLQSSATIPTGTRVNVTSGPYNGTFIEVLTAKADHAGRGTYWHISGAEVLP